MAAFATGPTPGAPRRVPQGAPPSRCGSRLTDARGDAAAVAQLNAKLQAKKQRYSRVAGDHLDASTLDDRKQSVLMDSAAMRNLTEEEEWQRTEALKLKLKQRAQNRKSTRHSKVSLLKQMEDSPESIKEEDEEEEEEEEEAPVEEEAPSKPPARTARTRGLAPMPMMAEVVEEDEDDYGYEDEDDDDEERRSSLWSGQSLGLPPMRRRSQMEPMMPSLGEDEMDEGEEADKVGSVPTLGLPQIARRSSRRQSIGMLGPLGLPALGEEEEEGGGASPSSLGGAESDMASIQARVVAARRMSRRQSVALSILGDDDAGIAEGDEDDEDGGETGDDVGLKELWGNIKQKMGAVNAVGKLNALSPARNMRVTGGEDGIIESVDRRRSVDRRTSAFVTEDGYMTAQSRRQSAIERRTSAFVTEDGNLVTSDSLGRRTSAVDRRTSAFLGADGGMVTAQSLGRRTSGFDRRSSAIVGGQIDGGRRGSTVDASQARSFSIDHSSPQMRKNQAAMNLMRRMSTDNAEREGSPSVDEQIPDALKTFGGPGRGSAKASFSADPNAPVGKLQFEEQLRQKQKEVKGVEKAYGDDEKSKKAKKRALREKAALDLSLEGLTHEQRIARMMARWKSQGFQNYFLAWRQYTEKQKKVREAQNQVTKYLEVLTKEPWDREDSDIEMLYEFVKQIKFFQGLNLTVAMDLCRMFRLEEYEEDEIGVRQGDEGTTFYIVLYGQVSIWLEAPDDREKEPKERTRGRGSDEESSSEDDSSEDADDGRKLLVVLGQGAAFGELALLKNQPRAATVQTDEPTWFVVIDKEDYDETVKSTHLKNIQNKVDFLCRMPLFRDCSTSEMNELVSYFAVNDHTPGSEIISQGSDATNLFFVVSGEVDLVKTIYTMKQDKRGVITPKTSKALVQVCKSGSFFGEHAIVNRQQQPYTGMTKTGCTTYSLSLHDFFLRLNPKTVQAFRTYCKYSMNESETGRCLTEKNKWDRSQRSMMRAVLPDIKGADLGDAKKLKGVNVAQWSEKREVAFKSKRKKEVIGSGYKALTSKFGLAAAIDVLQDQDNVLANFMKTPSNSRFEQEVEVGAEVPITDLRLADQIDVSRSTTEFLETAAIVYAVVKLEDPLQIIPGTVMDEVFSECDSAVTAIANKIDVIRWSSVCLIFLCSQGTKAEMLESVADATLQVNAKIEEITERVNKDIPDDEDPQMFELAAGIECGPLFMSKQGDFIMDLFGPALVAVKEICEESMNFGGIRCREDINDILFITHQLECSGADYILERRHEYSLLPNSSQMLRRMNSDASNILSLESSTYLGTSNSKKLAAPPMRGRGAAHVPQFNSQRYKFRRSMSLSRHLEQQKLQEAEETRLRNSRRRKKVKPRLPALVNARW